MLSLLSTLEKHPAIVIVLRKIVELNFRKEKNAIRRYLQLRSGERVVDIGCGTGEFAPLFPASQYEGIDLDPANISYAKKHYPSYRFQVGDALHLPFPDASFDAALVCGVLHHLSDDEARGVITEMRRVLKLSGKALVMEDTKTERLVSRIMHDIDQGAHIRSERAWNEMMRSSFRVEHSWSFTSGICYYTGFVLV